MKVYRACLIGHSYVRDLKNLDISEICVDDKFKVQFKYIFKPGATISYFCGHNLNSLFAYKPDVVFIVLGGNDLRADLDIHDTIANFSSDDFIQFFVWKGLNKGFQIHLINITGKTKPSIKEIVDNFFFAYERYSADQKYRKSRATKQGSSKEVTKSASFATKVNTKTSNSVSRCSLCSNLEDQESNHPLFPLP